MADLIMTISNGRGPAGPQGPAGEGVTPPSEGNTLTGALDLSNSEGTYYNAKTITEALTFSIVSGDKLSGWARGRIICDGINPFASDANFKSTFNERIIGIADGFPSNYILPPGTYSFYAWKTDSGYSISMNGPIEDSSAPADNIPTASSVAISGTKKVGETLTGSYTYADADSDAETTSTFKWYRADDGSGTNLAAISGATSLTYVLQNADEGKYIRFGVIPVNAVASGNEAFSSYTTAIAAADVPDTTPPAKMTINDVTITGTDGDFTATLNGGDLVTPKNDLIFKIYGSADSYTTPIKITGSHTTDADVTVTGDSVTINNVNVGSETLFKITALDAAANESVKSDEYDTANPELNYSFDGTSIDTNEWEIINPTASGISFAQNDMLIVTKVGAANNPSTRANRIQSIRKFKSGTFEFDYSLTSIGTNSNWSVCLLNPDTDRSTGLLSPTNSPFDKIRTYAIDSTADLTADDYASPTRVKFVYDGADIDIYYDIGSGYVLAKQYSVAIGDFVIAVTGINGDLGAKIEFDNLKITNFVLA